MSSDEVVATTLAYHEGDVVGLGVLRSTGLVTDLCVAQEFQKLGIARRILNRLLRESATGLIQVEAENSKTFELYSRMGFARI